MDVRYSPEQQALRDAAARLCGQLGPRAVGQLADAERASKLDAAVAAAGWREMRVADDGDAPSASAVEAAIIAEELGRTLADTAFIGPTLAAELRRRAGVAAATSIETVVFERDLSGPAVAIDGVVPDGVIAVDAQGSDTALLLVPDGSSFSLAEVVLGRAEPGTDLTRAVAPAGQPTPMILAGQSSPSLTAADVDGVAAFGLALTCADLVGVMVGAVDLTVEYASGRRQFGRVIGSFQAVQHLLAHAFVLMEGSRSVALHAAWAVDALAPGEARDAAAVAKAYCARSARTVGETAIQVHGGIGNTWECLAHVFLRRALLSSDLFGGTAASIERVLGTHGVGVAMDFGDSPAEATFRARLRLWLEDNDPGLPASSTDDAYWVGQAAWHRSLFEGGFFGMTWPTAIGGQGLPSVYDVIVDEELAAAGAPPRPSLGYLVEGILEHGSEQIQQRFLPGIVSGRDRWCQGFSEPDAGSDLASLRTRADLDGDEYVVVGHKVWTSYSDDAEWCLVLARTDHDVAKHHGISAFAVPMDQPGIERRPLPMINGITKEFGEVIFDRARVPAANMIGGPGEGWRVAMTVVSHEREPHALGFAGRYQKLVKDLTKQVRDDPARYGPAARQELGWAIVEAEMLRLHVARRLSDRLDGITHGPGGSVDKLLMTWTEQTVGHAALAVGGPSGPVASAAGAGQDDTWLKVYLYSRAQSVMGGTSQIQANLIAGRILGLPVS